MHEIHTSDVKSYMECRRRWNYSSPLRMSFESVMPNMNLILGRLMHEALHDWYEHKHPKRSMELLDHLWDNEYDYYEHLAIGDKVLKLIADSRELSAAMLRHYILFSKRNDRFEVIALERKAVAAVPCRADASIVGRLDVVAVDENGRTFILDHKTTSRIPNLQDVQIDIQPMTYLFLWPEAQYFIFNYLYKREPMIPATLKDGRLSRAKLSDTTLEIYAARLKHLGHSWESYPDVYLELKNSPNKFFVRHRINKSEPMISLHATNLAAIATEMLDPLLPIYPSPDRFKCSWCAFRDPCMMENVGVTPIVTLQSNYVKKEGWHYG